MIITIEIPNDIINDNAENGDSSFDITLETKFLHKSRKCYELYGTPMGKVTEVWTNEGGCRNLKFSVLDA
jgi:hypothetical protein